MSVVQLPARVTLGCSDLAAAAGVDPYTSPIRLWLHLTGRVERPETEAMTWGRLLEPVVADVFAETTPIVYPADETLTDPERPWLTGHPDGYLPDTPPAILELKTANAWAHAHNGDGVPPHYDAQVQGYMHLKGYGRAVVATLVAGQRLEIREVRRDDRAIGLLLELAERFLGYVQRDEPPPPTAQDRDALTLLYPEHAPGRIVRADRQLQELARELRARRSQRDAIDAQVTELENILKAHMGDAETLIGTHDQPLATWKAVTSNRLDVAELRKQRPELAGLFTVETQTRRFTVA